ncbi:patatin-like phospholipase family protein [Planococcus donghaensis]|uniref:Patatin n=1 Tax=Planococcus donghaensis TaxID=414778 RepID=A0A1C7EF07_9BACL|nr:patatin-like phospholipase family protein [Planococcus donghaensis]ANU21977.1 patatin [Planococcus donghaensis]
MKKILSIDGGGVRGVIPALVLAEIEKRTGKPISELFDLIAGTSTGGLLTLGLVSPNKNATTMYTALELVQLYENERKVIFANSFQHRLLSLGGLLDERYPSTGAESVFEKYFGDAKLSEALTDVIITSYEIETRTSWFFKSRKAKMKDQQNRDAYMKDVARATSAAPTYFEPKQIKMHDTFSFIDGGVFANNPAMCAYVEAKCTYLNEENFLVVSLGTGEQQDPILYKDAKDWGLAEWAGPLLNVVFDGVSDTVDYQLRNLLPHQEGFERYYRFQTDLDTVSDKLDDSSDENFYALVGLAKDLIARNDQQITALCEQLK